MDALGKLDKDNNAACFGKIGQRERCLHALGKLGVEQCCINAFGKWVKKTIVVCLVIWAKRTMLGCVWEIGHRAEQCYDVFEKMGKVNNVDIFGKLGKEDNTRMLGEIGQRDQLRICLRQITIPS